MCFFAKVILIVTGFYPLRRSLLPLLIVLLAPGVSHADEVALGAAISTALPALLDSTSSVAEVDADADVEPDAIEVELGMLELKDLEGHSFEKNSLEGSGAVLVFWSMYCRTCPGVVSKFQEDKEVFSEKGLKLLPVHLFESDPAKILSFLGNAGLPFNTLAASNVVRQMLSIRVLPTVVVFDKDGNFEARIDGSLDEEGMRLELMGKLKQR